MRLKLLVAHRRQREVAVGVFAEVVAVFVSVVVQKFSSFLARVHQENF